MKSGSTFIIRPKNSEQESALKAFLTALKMKFELKDEGQYDPEFVERLQESRKQAKEGKTTKVNKEDLSKLLGL